ncbi:MAG: putative peptidoglycan lipid flippase [Pseudonocardiales bacterium]|nr:putative peptidoglycan lipid flippase [Pseudonocardiales bacterium]
MTGTVQEDDWSTPTHYSAGKPIEPRALSIGGDPMTTMFPADWGDEREERWGRTTYVGKPSRRQRKRGPAAEVAEVAEVAAAPPAADEHAAADERAVGVEPEPAPTEEPVADSSDRGVIANSRSMAVASLTSRVTGFLRSIMLVAALGTGAVGNAYNSGNTLPNMIYELLLGGVLSSVLIPLLVHAESEDDDGGLAYTQRLLSMAVASLGAMTILVVAAAPWIAAVFVPAGSQRELTSIFATLLLPEIFFYGLGAMFMAVLNIKHVYGPGAWSPVLNNVVMMLTVLVFWTLPGPKTLDPSSMTNAQILVIGIGTTLGIAAQALVLVPALRRTGFTWQWRFRAHPGQTDRMREIGQLAGWVLGYVVVSQIGVSVIQRIGNENGGFSIFTYADLLFQMPYGILVVSVLTAIMPRLSRAAVRNDTEAVKDDLSFGARLSAVALVPVTAGLIVLGPAMGVTLFAYGEASIANAQLIGSTLAWSAFGLFPFALVMLQLRVFYAMRDGRTPTLINAVMVATKVVLVLVSNEAFKAPAGTDVNEHPSVRAVEWLNISTSLSYVVGAIIGHVLLTRRLGLLGFRRVGVTVLQIGGASAIAGLAAWGVVQGAEHLLGGGHAGSALGLGGGAIVGLLVLGAVLWRMRIPDVQEVAALARRR